MSARGQGQLAFLFVRESMLSGDLLMHSRAIAFAVFVTLASLAFWRTGFAQDRAPNQGANSQSPEATQPPATPKGVEVMARGPVHEAFATPTGEPVATKPVPKKPPQPLEEMPPDQKPQGDVIWVKGYWAWDDDRQDYLWVSGIWRTVPPGKQWVAGYWRADGEQHQWVPGFWTNAATDTTRHDVTYLPTPPTAPAVSPPGQAPAQDTFYVPGVWVWSGDHYMWKSGYWARVQPGYVWVPDHYRWTPSGYVFIPGYWDLAIHDRGVLFAPVVVDYAVVGPTFVYTPAYVVPDVVVMDAFFVRPCFCHYYFGDYYGPTYVRLGFESGFVYSRHSYDAIVVYSGWEHRAEPAWASVQLNVFLARDSGRAPLPARTLVQQNTIVQNNITNVTNVNNVNVVNNSTTVNKTIMPVSQMSAATGTPTVTLNRQARMAVQQQAQSVQQVAAQRSQTERAMPAGSPTQPRTGSLNLPPAPSGTARSAGGPRSSVNNLPVNSSTTSPVNSSPTSHVGQPGQPSTGPYGPNVLTGSGSRPNSLNGRPPYGPNGSKTPPPTRRPPPKSQQQQSGHGQGNGPPH
jgi:hypothetical protein